MSQRVTDGEVRDILNVPTTIALQPFIVAASLIVDERASTVSYSAARLKELERWLAAHFACIRYPQIMQARTDTESMSFERGVSGTGLRATSYGQQVLTLDTQGMLATLGDPYRRATLKVD